MIEKLRSYLLLLSFIVILGGLMLYMYVLAKGDSDLFGSGSGTLQPVDFETLTYQVGDSGHLLCDQALCGAADADRDAEIFNVDAGRLRQIVADYTDGLPTVETFSFDFKKNQFDFLERLPGETFPTVVTLRILRDTSFSSKLALYSVKPVGSSSVEQHAERAERWLTELHALANGQ